MVGAALVAARFIGWSPPNRATTRVVLPRGDINNTSFAFRGRAGFGPAEFLSRRPVAAISPRDRRCTAPDQARPPTWTAAAAAIFVSQKQGFEIWPPSGR